MTLTPNKQATAPHVSLHQNSLL